MSSSLTAFSSLRIAAAAIAAAAALGATSARALTTEEILNYQGPDRQKILEDGARREGTVFIYSGMIVNQLLRPLTEAFEKKYPFIKTRYWRGDGNQILFKVISEMQANAPEADLVEGSGIGAVAVAGSKIVSPFYSPMFEILPKQDIAPDRTWVATRFRYIGLGYNTNYVSRDAAPKSYEDLLDPRWKGKMAWHANSDASGALLTISALLADRGEQKTQAYLAKLATQDIAPLAVSNRQVVDQVILGEYWIGLGISAHHPVISASQGAPSATVLLDPIPSLNDSIQVLKGNGASERRDAVRRFHPIGAGPAHDAGGRVFSLQPERRAFAEPEDDRAAQRGDSGADADARAAPGAHAAVGRALQAILSLKRRARLDGAGSAHQYRPVPPTISVNTPSSRLIPTMMRI